jgi:thioredoxin 1
MAGATVEVTDANLGELTGNGVALVDFWGEQCPPCRLQGPIVDKVAERFAGRATVGKLDVESNRKGPVEFGVMFIPTLIIFKDGKDRRRFTGLTQENALASELEAALADG